MASQWPTRVQGAFRFAVFEVDFSRGELRKHGLKLHVAEQPLQILEALLERPGEIVSREDLIKRLWPPNTLADVDHGLNAAVAKLRKVLSDSPASPRFIETVAQRGYRLLCPVERVDAGALEVPAAMAGQHAAGRRKRNWIPLAAVAGLALAAASAMMVWRYATPTEPGPQVAHPLATFRGSVGPPSISPDGNQVAFEWQGPQKGDAGIYVMPVPQGEGKALRVTDHAADVGPAWSPNGRWIAFRRNGDVLVVPPTGGTARTVGHVLPANPTQRPLLGWTPDSKSLVVVHAPGGSPPSLFLLSIESGELRRLTTSPPGALGDWGPAVSPDGRWLAFHRTAAPYWRDVYVLPLGRGFSPAGEPSRITFDGGESPVWTPDGRSLVFSSRRETGEARLWRVAVAGGTHTPVRLFVGEDAFFPAIAKSGRLVYRRSQGEGGIWRLALVAPDRVAGPPSLLISSTRTDHSPQFSPDGKKIAFTSSRSGPFEIWIANADGQNAWQLTDLRPYSGSAMWSPDGQWIAFDSIAEGVWRVYVMPSAGGKPRRITSGPGYQGGPSWSRDGKWIYYGAVQDDRYFTYRIWKVPFSGGSPVRVTQGAAGRCREAPDGKTLYYARGLTLPATLWHMPVGGGKETQVPGVLARTNAFVPTADGLYVMDVGEKDSPGTLKYIHRATGRVSVLARLPYPAGLGLSLSPDGRTLLFAQLEAARSELMYTDGVR
jgi:Tol biopolymer transport system component/DNA-binding winged helix-turn-helix (wHTH) protein